VIEETERRPGLPLNPGVAVDELMEWWWVKGLRKKTFKDL
jgi:hypothetical protein